MPLIKSISGIRGTIGGAPGASLTPLDTTRFAAAYGSWLIQEKEVHQVVLGRDARISGEMLSAIVANTLMGMGIDVIDLGLATTPTVEMAVVDTNSSGGIILSASHNPAQWNALKLLNDKGEFISAEAGEKILQLADSEDFTFATNQKLGNYREDPEALKRHIRAICDLKLVNVEAIRNAGFKLVVDGINSVGAFAVPELLEALGLQDYQVINEVADGHFAHNPEPLPEHINDICQKVIQVKADAGIVVDPDVDRLALVDEYGEPFGEEYTLVAVADYVLSHKKGNAVSNLSSSRALKDITLQHSGEYHASAVGEVNVVKEMRKQKAVIGGEGNGGVIYPELHYGRDALVGIALFLSHLATAGKSASAMRKSYPSYFISKNKMELTADLNLDHILEEITRKYKEHHVSTIDGVRIDFGKEWVHLRKSNTEPIIRIIAESDSHATADHLAQKLMEDMKDIMTQVVN